MLKHAIIISCIPNLFMCSTSDTTSELRYRTVMVGQGGPGYWYRIVCRRDHVDIYIYIANANNGGCSFFVIYINLGNIVSVPELLSRLADGNKSKIV